MRVAVVSRCARTLYVFRRGLILGAIAEGAEVTAIGADGDGFDRNLREAQIHFEPAPIRFSGLTPLSDLRLIFDLAQRFRRGRVDVCHAFTIKPAIFATLAARMAQVPVRVVTITGLGYAFTSATGVLRRLVEWLYRCALGQAHIVFFQNPEDRRLFVERGLVSEGKTELVPGSGVDARRFVPVPLPCASGGAPVFLMIARLLRDKGVLEYCAAARQLRRHCPGARCLLLGGEDPRNPSRLTPQELAQLKASPEIELLGEVDDVRPIISRADVVVLPSYREGLPRSLLEGGAMGRALIATDVPGCSEVVQHERNGLIVPRADAESFARAMVRLCENPSLIASYGSTARTDIETRFDEQKVIDNTLATYRRLFQENAKGRSETAAR